MIVYFSTIGGREGRSSRFYKFQNHAQDVTDKQNERAEKLGIKAVYLVGSCDAEGIPTKEIK